MSFFLEKGSLVISKQPQPAECSFGDSVSFEIEAESFELLSYQWYKDDEKLLGIFVLYRIHDTVAMSPVFHVEGCRTLLGSVGVHHQLSGLYVFVAFHLYFLPSLFYKFL
jgi:hypothetical protein